MLLGGGNVIAFDARNALRNESSNRAVWRTWSSSRRGLAVRSERSSAFRSLSNWLITGADLPGDELAMMTSIVARRFFRDLLTWLIPVEVIQVGPD